MPADLDDSDLLKGMFHSVQKLIKEDKLLAYHDRSDGGLFVTLCEMAFAGQVGLEIDLDKLGFETSSILFSEELGAVVQVAKRDLDHVLSVFKENDLESNVHRIGHITDKDEISFYFEGERVLSNSRTNYRDMWAQTTLRMQTLRDNPKCAQMEHKAKLDPKDPGLNVKLSFDVNERITKDMTVRPKVAILREQGVNGQLEMAAAFDRAGFSSVDVHMSDLLSKRVDLKDFRGLVACGGFSYGDVLGAGEGWAKTILHTPHLSEMFKTFFERKDSFSLGVCNGCQMLSNLKSLIPGAKHWPKFVKNESDRFEARFSLVEIKESPSIFFDKMAGSRMPIAVAHGEGRVEFSSESDLATAKASYVAMNFVDNYGEATTNYPANLTDLLMVSQVSQQKMDV